jgi:hypothetical protein
MFRGSFCVGLIFVCLVCHGCGNTSHPGNWPQSEIEAYMLKTENPRMSEVSIKPDPEGGFSGTGKSADGETFQLTIKQDADLKRLSWSAKGDRGTKIEDGRYEYVN